MLKIKRFLKYKRCISCGQEFLDFETRKINRTDYICADCLRSEHYSTKNSNVEGKEKSISFSFEYETSIRAKSLYELKKYDFICCYDGSIGGLEWKSPIFYSRKAFHNICKKLNSFARYVGNDCGTHLHVSTPYKVFLQRYQHELFQPILNVMTSDREKTKKFWGRYFGGYCESDINDFSRYNAFNTFSSVQTLEYRLLKFRNAEQYIRAADFCIDITKFLNTNINPETFNEQKARRLGNVIAKKYKEVIKDV